ncbi:hypothetical protein ACNOYE_22830 [Nannocystaceae bacterium ST9]
MAIVALTGCKHDPGPSSASIEFVLGNDKECAEVGVETMHVVLSRGEGADRVELYEEYAPCVDGPVIVEDIAPKNYDLLVEGLDEAMIVVFDNLGSPASQRKIEIFDGSQAQTTVELTARPSDLLVRWRLGQDGFGNCAGVGIDRFNVRAFETGGGTLLLEHEFDCETTGEDADGYRLVPDPERVLNGTRLGEVGIQALDASGTELGEPATFVFDPVGPGYPTKLTLECSNVGCTGSGTTD